jgi:hypothetical protein
VSVPTSISVFVDRSGLMPVVPQQLVFRTANPVPVGKFYRALGLEIHIATAGDGTRYYSGRTIGLELSIVPAAETAPHVGNLHFIVDDFQRTLGFVTAEGGKLVRPVVGIQRRAVLLDPDGRQVIIGDQASFQSQFEESGERNESGNRDGPEEPIEFGDPAVRRGLQFERAAAVTVAAGTLIAGIAALAVFGRIASGTERDYLLMQMKPSQSGHYIWLWFALIGEAIVVLGRAIAIGSSGRFAKTGYVILALCVECVAIVMGLACLLGKGEPLFMGSILFVVALGGIVASSRVQEAAGRFRRKELRFWTKGATGAWCAVFVLPLVAAIISAALPRGSKLAIRVLQAMFLAGLAMQFCLHAVYAHFVHKAINDPKSVTTDE